MLLSLYRQFSNVLSSSILSVSNLRHLLSQINKTYHTLKMAISWRRKSVLPLDFRRVKQHHSTVMIIFLGRIHMSLGRRSHHSMTNYSDRAHIEYHLLYVSVALPISQWQTLLLLFNLLAMWILSQFMIMT